MLAAIQRTGRNVRAILRDWEWKRLAVIAVCFWAPVILFVQLADEVYEQQAIPFDIEILQWARDLSSPLNDVLAVSLTTMGGTPGTVAVLTLGLLFLLRRHRRRAAVFFGTSIGGAAIINVLLKFLFQRDRPNLWETIITESTYSFPSGHAMMSSVVAFSVIALAWNTRWRWLAIIAGTIYFVSVSFTRVYLGVHYPSDIIAGWCVSGAWVLLVYGILFGKGRRASDVR